MPRSTYFKSGEYNAVCDVCGFLYKASQLRKRWDGLYVCHKDYEIRQPLDYPVLVLDDPAPNWSRPYGLDLNTNGTELELVGRVQISSGSGSSPEIQGILSTSTVTLTMAYQEGPTGTYTVAITPGVGFMVTSSSQLDLSSLNYTVTI